MCTEYMKSNPEREDQSASFAHSLFERLPMIDFQNRSRGRGFSRRKNMRLICTRGRSTSTRPPDQEVASTAQPAKICDHLHAQNKIVLTLEDKNLLEKMFTEISPELRVSALSCTKCLRIIEFRRIGIREGPNNSEESYFLM